MQIYIDGRRADVGTTMSREMGFGRAIRDPVPFALRVPDRALVEAVSELYLEFMSTNEMELNQGILEEEDHWMLTLERSLEAQIRRDPERAAFMIHEWFMPETFWRLLPGPEDRDDLEFVLNSAEQVRWEGGVWVFEGQGWRVVTEGSEDGE